MLQGKSILTGVSASHHGYMIDPSGASGSARQEVLQGIPIDEIFPDKDIWDVVTSPYYFSGVVHIPGGYIEDPLAISKLSDFNKFLVNIQYDFHEGVIQPDYTQSLQRELDVTSAELLPAKLDFMLNREYENWYHWWYFQTFGGGSSVSSPLDLCREYENWYNWYSAFYINNLGGRSFVPCPLEQFSTIPLIPMKIGNFFFSFANPSLFLLLTVSLVLLLLYFVTKKERGEESTRNS